MRERSRMVELRRTQILFLMLVLQFSAVTGHTPLTVREGEDVTLDCKNVLKDQVKCDNTTWIFSHSGNTMALFEKGKIHNDAKAKSDRLNVTVNCSLVIKKLTAEDAGVYTCRQFNKSGKQQGSDISYQLTVNKSVKPTTTTTTIKSTTTTSSITISSTKKAETITPTTKDWWRYIIAAVGLAALLITVVVVVVIIRRKKPAGNNIITQMDENTADPEDGVAYASISYIKNTSGKARGRCDDDDDDDTVTYSTVKASSSSAGASADPSNLYATVNKPQK